MALITLPKDQLAHLMAVKGVTQSQLQVLAGVGHQAFAKINSGQPIRTDVAAKIGRALDGLPDSSTMRQLLGEEVA